MRATNASPTGRLLLVSPHLDDAALSCAALIERPEPIDVLTVFAGEPDPPRQGSWDNLTGFPSSRHSMAARRDEDAAAFSGTPHSMRTMSLLELQYHDVSSRASEDAAIIADALGAWADDGGGTVALPAGAGRRRSRLRARIERTIGPRGGTLPHEDHVFLRDAGLAALVRRRDVTMLLYEELPYAWGGRAERAVADAARPWGLNPAEIRLPVDRIAKARRIGAYASQVPHFWGDGRRLDDPDALPPVERYWRLLRQPATGGVDT